PSRSICGRVPVHAEPPDGRVVAARGGGRAGGDGDGRERGSSRRSGTRDTEAVMSERTRKYWTRPTGRSALDHWLCWIYGVVDSGAQLPNGADARALRSFLRAVAKEYRERKWTEYPGFCESCGRKI